MSNTKITCIGCGNMGLALVKGLVGAGIVTPARVTVSDKIHTRLTLAHRELRVKTMKDNVRAVRRADVIFLAVKPQILDQVLAEIKDVVPAKALLISIAAGFPTNLIESLLGGRPRVVRAMPNIAAVVGAAATAICGGEYARRSEVALAHRLLEACGTVIEVDEGLMDAVTGLSGTGPMYIFIIIEALSDAGVRMGLSREDATHLATQTVLGAAKMVEHTGQHPIFLKDLVTSPGGTAINALYSMEKTGLRAVLMEAVETATRRSRELGQPYNGAHQ
ncbi:MAG TPA: pyrroline-5-carboxylate reductase [Myxococcota bacterium]|nr:pyrroline-5-carboxylate reductase [Myxococcota bacterium]